MQSSSLFFTACLQHHHKGAVQCCFRILYISTGQNSCLVKLQNHTILKLNDFVCNGFKYLYIKCDNTFQFCFNLNECNSSVVIQSQYVYVEYKIFFTNRFTINTIALIGIFLKSLQILALDNFTFTNFFTKSVLAFRTLIN